MFPITLTISTPDQLEKVLNALNFVNLSAAPSGSPTTAPSKADLKPKKTEAPAEGNDVQTVSAQPTAEAPKDDAPAAKAVTYAELQAAVLKLHKADSSAAKPIAEGMGFPNFKAMPDDKWAEALGKVEAELAKRGV